MRAGYIFGLCLGSKEKSPRLPPTLVYHETPCRSPHNGVGGGGRILFSVGLRWNFKQHLRAVMQARGLLSLKEYFVTDLQCG